MGINMNTELRSLIKEYRDRQSKFGRSLYKGDPYRMKIETLKERLANDTDETKDNNQYVEDINSVEVDDLKNDTDFIDVSDKLSQPSMEISNEPEFDNEDDTDNNESFEEEYSNDGAEIDESFEIYQEEESQQSFMPLDELAKIIVDLHDHVPIIASKFYGKLVLKGKSTMAEAKIIDKKVKQSVINKQEVDLTENEREIYELYTQIEEYKENAKPSDQTKELLHRAWKIQLKKWGYDNIDVDKNSMLFAYGVFGLQLGIPFIPHLNKIRSRKN